LETEHASHSTVKVFTARETRGSLEDAKKFCLPVIRNLQFQIRQLYDRNIPLSSYDQGVTSQTAEVNEDDRSCRCCTAQL
jgi:hypothetical protein